MTNYDKDTKVMDRKEKHVMESGSVAQRETRRHFDADQIAESLPANGRRRKRESTRKTNRLWLWLGSADTHLHPPGLVVLNRVIRGLGRILQRINHHRPFKALIKGRNHQSEDRRPALVRLTPREGFSPPFPLPFEPFDVILHSIFSTRPFRLQAGLPYNDTTIYNDNR